MSSPPKDISFHYTNPQMALDCISLLNLKVGDKVLDAGSGKNKVWMDNLPKNGLEKYECELEDGNNFYEFAAKMDWVIGNPPYHESWKFTEKAITIAEKGVAWLLNNQAMNSHLTPARLARLHLLGWHYTKIHVVADHRWFGRYYFLVLEKKENDFISWERKTY